MQNRYFSVFKTPAAALTLVASLAIGSFAEDNINLIEVSNNPANQGIFYQITRIIDFSQSSASFPVRNYPTWTNPASGAITEYAQPILQGGPSGTCFEVSSSAIAVSDPVFLMPNNTGAYQSVADDNNGSGQFKARIFVLANQQAHLRVAPFSATGTDASFFFKVQKIQGIAGSGTTSANCRVSTLPYHQSNLNNGVVF